MKKITKFFKTTYKCLHNPLYVLLIILVLFIGISFYTGNINFVSTGIAALLGAGAAFAFNMFLLEHKQRSKNIDALVETKYCIERILRFNNVIKKILLERKNQKGDDYDWRGALPHDAPPLSLNINIENLLFLLKYDEEGENTLNSILQADSENQEIVRIWEKRNQCYLSYLDNLADHKTIDENELKSIFCGTIHTQLVEYTEHFKDINNCLPGHCNTAKKNIEDFLNNHLSVAAGKSNKESEEALKNKD